MTEQEMREMEIPRIESQEELEEFFNTVVVAYKDQIDTQGDEMGEMYGKAVYVMSLFATAAFHYAAHVVGASGFQASCADLDVLRRTRRMDDGFRIINFGDLLYPQYEDKILGFWQMIEEQKEHLAPKAKKLLEENPAAHPNVIAHWRRIAE